MASRPIHKLKPAKSIVAYTWCGVDPYRKGVQIEGVGIAGKATCKDCLFFEAEEAKVAKVRFPIKTRRMGGKEL